MKVFIKSISTYLPSNSLTNEQLNMYFPEWSVDKISSKTGIYQRSIANSEEFSCDMAISAATKLFAENNIQPMDIDFVILCTQSPDYFLPTTACIIQDKLGIPTSAGAFDFNLGCSGYVYGLAISKGLIASGIAKNILFITSETYSKFIHPADKVNKTIFGDAAAATLITLDHGICSIDKFVFGTDGTGAENLIVKNGGVRNLLRSGKDYRDEYGNLRNDNNLFMNGREIFNFTIEKIPSLIKIILQKSGLSLSEVDLFVFHQANKFMLEHLRKKIGIPEDKFILNLERCGNTVSSTIPIALSEAIKNNKFENLTNCILAGFGVGYSWGACNLKISK